MKMEDKTILIKQINERVAEILDFLELTDDDKLHLTKDSKWSIAENIVHLNKSVAPINMALNLPKFSFIPFGKAKKSEGRKQIVERYHSALKSGGKAPNSYVPNNSTANLSKSNLMDSFQKHYAELTKRLNKWSEENLDTYRLPHPLIGKITVRDMISFTIYHLEHHNGSIKELN